MSELNKRDVHVVLAEFLAARERADDFRRLRAEILALIGEDHSHDPMRCIRCQQWRYQSAMGGQ